MRHSALHTAGAATARDARTARPDAPSSPLPRHPPGRTAGLEPTATVTRTVDDGPVSALRVERFDDGSLAHRAAVSVRDGHPRLTVGVASESDDPVAVRTARTPAPFPGGYADGADGRTLAADAHAVAPPVEGRAVETVPASDTRTLAPDERVDATAWLVPVGGDWAAGEYTFSQGYTVWTAETAHVYTWRVTVVV